MQGEDTMRTCPECGGEGAFERSRPFHDDPYFCEVVKCADCNGSGYVDGPERTLTLDEALELDAEKLEALQDGPVICPTCRGERRLQGYLCHRCGGTAQIARSRLLPGEAAPFEEAF